MEPLKLSSAWKDVSEEEDPADNFARSVNMLRSQYHGGAFDGNQCTGLLNSINKLQAILPSELAGYIDCLKAFKDVTTACFRKELDRDYHTTIITFGEKFDALNISHTPSIHAV
jgi:hypothetical protein